MMVQNFKLWGYGGTGIRAIKKSNVTVTNCDIYQGGGAFLTAKTTRYGDGIGLEEGGENIFVYGCFISMQYEEGFTMQSHGR